MATTNGETNMASKIVALCIVTIAVASLSERSYAQRNLSGAARAQEEMMEMQMRWNASKKLTLRKDLDVKKLPFPLQGEDRLDEMEVGDIAKVGYFHFQILSIVDDQNCLLSLGSKVYWLTGYPTEGLSDDQAVRLVDPVKLQEPRKDGSRTVRCLKMLEPEESDKWEARAKTQDKRNKRGQDFQTYKLADGEEFFASVLEIRANGVLFEDEDGKKVRKQMKDFDEESQGRIREQIKIKRGKK